MKKQLVPFEDKVIIKPKDSTTISSGGVHLPEGAIPEAICGTVIAVGPGLRDVFGATISSNINGADPRWPMTCKIGDIVYSYPKYGGADPRWPMTCKIGDIVYYPKYGANKFEYDGVEYVIIKESELLSIEKEIEENNEE